MGRRGERGNGTGMREERENEKYLLSLYKSLHHRNNKKKKPLHLQFQVHIPLFPIVILISLLLVLK